MLDADEQIEAICGYTPCAAVTNKRLIIMRNRDMLTIPFDEITKISRASKSDPLYGNNQTTLRIQAKEVHNIESYSIGFKDFCAALENHIPNT